MYESLALQATVSAQMHKHVNSQDCCRAALVTGKRWRYVELARELNVLVDMLKKKLSEADVPLKQQHWVMCSGLEAYLCLWQCCEYLKDTTQLQGVRCKQIALAANDILHLKFSVSAVVYMYTMHNAIFQKQLFAAV